MSLSTQQATRGSTSVLEYRKHTRHDLVTLGNLVINGDVFAEQDADRITSNGWTVALFNALEDVLLIPNESRIIEVGVQAPGETSGTISVDIVIQPTNFPFRSVRESATVNISWDRSFLITSNRSIVPILNQAPLARLQ